MKPLVPLLIRDWLAFRKHIIAYLLFWILMPVFIHIFLAIPLSFLITLDIRYLNWSAAGVWITTTGMTAFLESAKRLRNIHYETRQIDTILESPVTNFDILMVILLRGIIFGFIQFIFALIIISTLNHEYISTASTLFITIQMLILIMFFSALGIFIGMVVSNGMVFIQVSFLLFLLITLGMGTFIPLEYYPDIFTPVLGGIPLMAVFGNVQAIITNDPIKWTSFFFMFALTMILFLTTLIISHKKFRKI